MSLTKIFVSQYKEVKWLLYCIFFFDILSLVGALNEI